MKKVLLVLTVVMLLTTAATMVMAATLAEWNFGMASYTVTPDPLAVADYYQYAPIDGSLASSANTTIRSAPKVPPIDNSLANWEQPLATDTAVDDYALGWMGKSGALHYAYTGLTTPYSESNTSNLQKSNWFTAERQTMTISCKVKVYALRYGNRYQNQFLNIGIGWSRGMIEPVTGYSQNLFHINGSFICSKNLEGGTNYGGTGNGTTSTTGVINLADYSSSTAERVIGENAAVANNVNNSGTGTTLLPTADWRGYAGVSIMRYDASYGTPYLSKYAERGGPLLGDPLPPPIPADPNAIPIAVNGADGIANNADDWYSYVLTMDFSSRTTAVYNVYLNNVLQATLVQNLPPDLPEGEYWTIREIRFGANNWFSGAIDDLKITDTIDAPAPPSGGVTGTVDLQGWTGAKLGEAVAVTITDANSNSETLNTTLDANGGYSVTTTLRGTCYISAKCSHWLSDGKEAVIDANGAAAVDFSMINGDCNNDNGVDEGDFGLLSAAWYSSDGEPSFDARADLNGDGGVDEGDFGLLSAAWYQSGI